jgi:autotransporter strand-loop-strand O-heptosyltransferase
MRGGVSMEVKVHAHFNERTGYGIHASRFFPALDALVQKCTGGGTVHISLLDTVSASQINERLPAPSILYNVWESTEQPAEFSKRLSFYDQLWVPSEWQRACSIAQGIPEEFVKVVPEGVDPEIYFPQVPGLLEVQPTFNFLHVGQWQPRKSTREIVEAFLKAFPNHPFYDDVRLYLSVDTLFPSDEYKSTEERLKAYGLEDPRIIPVHFEERADYVRRLQSAHVFLSCSRSEGWFLPGIEAMACGIPSIFADYGGSTEYAGDALLVRVPELKKPHGIYGNWDVPGQWGEPDYNHLVEVMRDAYENYSAHKEKALKTSEMIRTKFSWDAAAQKAMKILEELSGSSSEVNNPVLPDPEDAIRRYARMQGFEITGLKKRSAIFTVDTHPNTKEKMDCLIETLTQIKGLGYPVLVSSHFPLPEKVIEMTDYYLFDKKDILSGEDRPVYWRTDGNKTETVMAGIPCHALAALHNVRNAVDFCLEKYDWVYQMNSDTEVDLVEWLKKVHSSDKDLILIQFEGKPGTVGGHITAGKTETMDKILLRIPTWDDFVKVYGDDRFCSEIGYYKLIVEKVGLDNVEFINMDVGNRFNQVDKNAWKDDMFQIHFVEGPFLNIVGMSDREYDVTYGTPTGGNVYGLKQKVGAWSRPNCKYYQDWVVKAALNGEIKFEHTLDLKGRRVLICMSSKALGDTIAWIPYVDEFRKKHQCHVICSGWWQDIFDYPEIEFVKPGSGVTDIYASYEVGCFDGQLDKNVKNWRETTLQKVSSDILGLEYEPIRAKLKYQESENKKPYVCFSEFSTMKNKLWNREGAWQEVIDYLVSEGYECVSISAELTQLKNVTSHNGQPIEKTISDISGAEFYIGLNAGPSWIAYALNVPCVMVTGVSVEENDFPNPYRVSVDVGCKPCFHDVNVEIQRGWEWCPSNKDYACTKEITPEMVIETIKRIRG